MRFLNSGFLHNTVVPGPTNRILKQMTKIFLGCDLWDQVLQNYATTRGKKSHATAPLKERYHRNCVLFF